MRYIKLFDSHINLNKNEDFFNSKIDWKLVRYIQIVIQDYTDMGYEFNLTLRLHLNKRNILIINLQSDDIEYHYNINKSYVEYDKFLKNYEYSEETIIEYILTNTKGPSRKYLCEYDFRKILGKIIERYKNIVETDLIPRNIFFKIIN